MTILYVVLAVTLVALIVLLIVFLIQRKKKKAAQAAGGGEQPSGDGADEISSLVRDADAKIAAARIQPGARVATLPAYLIMGDSGATKTSVMLHSGLDPELIAGQVYQGGNVAPTRTANFWFSRRSVFVEAGGRLPGEAAKWNKLVGRLAPKASVVGKGEQAPRCAVVCLRHRELHQARSHGSGGRHGARISDAAGRDLAVHGKPASGVRAFH